MLKAATLQWLVPAILAIVSLCLSGWVGYSHETSGYEHRVTVIETKVDLQGDRLERIENKVDKIFDILIRK